MRKFLMIAAALSAAIFQTILPADGQSIGEVILKDRDMAASIYHPYEPNVYENTPAPKGFNPFYISHYGRHGSRFHTSLKNYGPGVTILEKADSLGILTADGDSLLSTMKEMESLTTGMVGQLTERGHLEHRQIAARMYDRFKPVFRHRKEVDAVSTTVPRCIISMAEFTSSLREKDKKLEISLQTGDKYTSYLAKGIEDENILTHSGVVGDSLRKALNVYDTFLERIFTDPERAARLLGSEENMARLARSVYLAGADFDDIGLDARPVFDYLDDSLLISNTIAQDTRLYYLMGGSTESGDSYRESSKELILDIVDKADKAIEEGSGRAADLRFGHDTGLLPLISTIGIEGADKRHPYLEAYKYWNAATMIPMGSNLQMIFYRNRKGQVLVKLLYNEKETKIPALQAYSGPYYRWDELRSYLIGKTL